MSSPNDVLSVTERYARALRHAAPKIAAETPDACVDGYWLDGTRYFFLAERFEPSIDRLVTVPSIADVKSGRTNEVIGLDRLSGLLCAKSKHPVDLKTLATAIYDMPDVDTLAVSVAGLDALVDVQECRVLSVSDSLAVRALHSPDGRHAAFVKGYDVWIRDRHTGAERALTTDGALHNAYGRQSDTCLSAVSYRHSPKPVGLWSPDSQWFLTHRIDERTLPDAFLGQHAPPGGGRPLLHTYKFALPGDPMPEATFVAIHVSSGRIFAIEDFPAIVTAYSPFDFRAAWFSDPDTAWFTRFDRFHKHVELIKLDLTKGIARIVMGETAESGYLDLRPTASGTPNIRTLPESDEIVWYSERDGWGHLYLYDAKTGALKNRITAGNWQVRDIVQVDTEKRIVLFLAGGIAPGSDLGRRALCSVGLDGSQLDVLVAYDGDVSVAANEPSDLDQDRPFRPANARSGLSPDGCYAAIRYTSATRGDRTDIVNIGTRSGFVIASVAPAADATPATHFGVLASDGVTQIFGVMFFPSDFDETRRYPLVDFIYPGPQIAWEPQSYGSLRSSLAKSLAELGFVTVMVDVRGAPLGSRAFHQAGYGHLLEPQLADHAAVVRQLRERFPFIDSDRAGIVGMSGGGLAAARALFDYGDTFTVGVSACGNHDSTYYLSGWSDKYRGPEVDGTWKEQANGAAAHKLVGKLLLISGDMDENVHVAQTLTLVDALIRANKDFDLLIVPNEGHSVLMTNGYAQRRAWDYLIAHLRDETPPKGFEIKFEPHELARCAGRFIRESRL